MSKKYTFEEPYISGGITREYKQTKLPTGFKPIFHETLKSIKTPSQAQLREFFGDAGQPKLYKSRGAPSPVIMNAMLRDYKTEKEITDLDVAKSHRNHKYINSTETQDRLDAYAPDKKFNDDINTINQSLDKIYGLSKKERDELKKLLLKDVVSKNLGGLVVNQKTVKLSTTAKDPITGKNIQGIMGRLRNAPNLNEDKDEKQSSMINNFVNQRSAKKSSGKKRKNQPRIPTTPLSSNFDSVQDFQDDNPFTELANFPEINYQPDEPTPNTKRRQTLKNFWTGLVKNPVPPVPLFDEEKSSQTLYLQSPVTKGWVKKGSIKYNQLVRENKLVEKGNGSFENSKGELIATKWR